MTNMPRARTSARSILIAAVCAATVTACGSTNSAGTASSGAASAHAAKVSLDIQVTGEHGAKPEHWTLQCEPAGGTHPDPQAACNALLHAKSPFTAVPDHVMCPMIPAGTTPETATVKGTWFGKHVDSIFTRGGCGMLRWQKIGQIFN